MKLILRFSKLLNEKLNRANPVRQLLRFALASLFESSRRHPGKLQSLYYNMSTAEIQSMLSTSIGRNEYNPNQDGNNEDNQEKILLDEAVKVFDRIVDNITGKSIEEIATDTKSIS
jgi:hypothetical protein